ncbi:MAG: hypothetical protein V3U65_11435 [Granulosicoccaceae bacterium]
MDNQLLTFSDLYFSWCQHKNYCLRYHLGLIRSALYALAYLSVATNLHANTDNITSNIILRAQHNYTAKLPDEFSHAIPFNLQYLPTSGPIPSNVGSVWRHSYDVRLLQRDNKLELIKPDGTRQLFPPIDKHNYVADKNPKETIEHKLQHYHLTTPKKTTIFFGSYPVAVTKQDNSVINLRYKNGILSRLFTEKGDELLLSYADNGLLVGVAQTAGASIKFNYDQYNRLASSRSPSSTSRYIYPTSPPIVLCTATTPYTHQQLSQQSAGDQQCDASKVPPSSSFQLSQLDPHSTKIDLRPKSCRSYFVDYNGIDRGIKLEAGMLRHSRYNKLISTIRSFPVVDFIDGREAVAVSTKDLTSKTYNPIVNPVGLYTSIIQDAQKVNDKFLSKLQTLGSVSATEKGVTTTIASTQIDSLRMELMIQAGVATPTQLEQIERARLILLTKWNIKLITVIIP